jgi:alpha-1,3-mannosyltransferase
MVSLKSVASKDATTASDPGCVERLVTKSLGTYVANLFFSKDHCEMMMALLLLVEFVGGIVIIQKVAYTEIDWIAYMQEVEGVLSGEMNYTNLKGDTGPLVYPAGFVYLYGILHFITFNGVNVRLAQYLFHGLYMVFIAVLFALYHRARVLPPWAFALICMSRRIHSIFVLRLFNDCWAMLFLYVAIYFFLKNRWSIGCLFFSLGVSIKMNILLFSPPLLLLLWRRFGFMGPPFVELSRCFAGQSHRACCWS